MSRDNIFDRVRHGLNGRLESVLPVLLPGGRIQGKEYVCGSLAGGPGDSCSTNLEKGVGGDFATGETWSDIIDLASQVWKIRPKEAADCLAEQYGLISAKHSASPGRQQGVNRNRKQAEIVIAIPADAPEPPKAHHRLGPPAARWLYHDAAGNPLHYVYRFEPQDKQGKEILPLCLCRQPGGALQWQWRAWPAPRPLYNLHKLARAGSDTSVLLVEGEKAADAAQTLFPGYVCTTWSGGANAFAKAGFASLKGRRIVIWPDNDQAGFKAALSIAPLLTDEDTAITILPVSASLPEAWDVADAPPAGFSPEVFLKQGGLPLSEFARLSVSRFPALREHHVAQALLTGSQNGIPDSQVVDGPEDDFVRPWPVLHPDALPGLVGEFIALAVRKSEADPAAVLATLLVRFGVEVYGYASDKGPYVRIGETVHPPRLYATIAGASAKARKGTSTKPVLRLFEDNPYKGKDAVPPAPHTGGPLSSGEGLAWRLRERDQGEETKGDDGAPKSYQDKRLFVLDEEFAAAMASIRREGNILSMTLRSLWDSGNYEPLTKNSQIRVCGAHVGIVTHITIPELQSRLDSMQITNGFANRFLWICARRSKLVPYPEPMPTVEFNPLRDEVWRRVKMAQGRDELHFTPQARAYWETVYPELSRDLPGPGGDIIARGEAQCVRLALVYALLDGAAAIDVAHLKSALAFWQYARDSALYIFGNMEEEGVSRKILALLREAPKSTSELYTLFNRHIQNSKLKASLQELIGCGLVLKTEVKTAGRPKMVYCCAKKENQG
ncbi:DUF3987 domain-containing protein [Desulfovibrio falkowii]|uniref:DUF3987 domain-containing protein n=1 Tax=Desulfovibrio sp. WGS1351 TaxID=3366814 RepID=UPI00372CE781